MFRVPGTGMISVGDLPVFLPGGNCIRPRRKTKVVYTTLKVVYIPLLGRNEGVLHTFVSLTDRSIAMSGCCCPHLTDSLARHFLPTDTIDSSRRAHALRSYSRGRSVICGRLLGCSSSSDERAHSTAESERRDGRGLCVL